MSADIKQSITLRVFQAIRQYKNDLKSLSESPIPQDKEAAQAFLQYESRLRGCQAWLRGDKFAEEPSFSRESVFTYTAQFLQDWLHHDSPRALKEIMATIWINFDQSELFYALFEHNIRMAPQKSNEMRSTFVLRSKYAPQSGPGQIEIRSNTHEWCVTFSFGHVKNQVHLSYPDFNSHHEGLLQLVDHARKAAKSFWTKLESIVADESNWPTARTVYVKEQKEATDFVTAFVKKIPFGDRKILLDNIDLFKTLLKN